MAPHGKACGTGFGTRQWINLEPCGLLCGMMTWVLLLFGMYATSKYVIIPWLGYGVMGMFHLFSFNGASLFGVYCHMMTMLTDPGSVPKESVPLADDESEHNFKAVTMEAGGRNREIDGNRIRSSSQAHIPVIVRKYRKFCKRCKAFKPSRAHHCSICGRCVVKMDHHCPWVNNCVGIGNQKLFLLFLLAVNVCCIYSLLLIIGKFMYCSSSAADTLQGLKESTMHISSSSSLDTTGISDSNSYAIKGTPVGENVHTNIHQNILHSGSSGSTADTSNNGCNQIDANVMIIFLLVESVLFGLFTLCMMGDQSTVLSTNQTQIDKLKGIHHDGIEGFNEVFGCDDDIKFQYDWLIPTPILYPDINTKDRVLGFRLITNSSMNTNNNNNNSSDDLTVGSISTGRDRNGSMTLSDKKQTDSRRRGSRTGGIQPA